MKRIFCLVLCFTMLFSAFACAKKEESEKIRLIAMTGPTGMGLAKLLHENNALGEDARYEAKLVSSPDQVVAPIANGTCDIAAVPINLASTLYQKTKGEIVILCANTLGVLYMVENGNAIESIKDLKGKTIYAPNPGSTPEYVLRYVLEQNGIDPEKDVTLNFLSGGDEVAAMLSKTPDAIGMLPEPKLSAFLSQNKDSRICLDMTEEWDKVSGEGNTLIQGVFIARRDFAEKNPDAVKQFLSDYKDSQKEVKENPENGAKWIVEAGIIPKEPLAKKAIPGSNITYLEGEEMKASVKNCLYVLFKANPKSVGGKMPDDKIYYEK